MFLTFREQAALPSVGVVRIDTYGDKNDDVRTEIAIEIKKHVIMRKDDIFGKSLKYYDACSEHEMMLLSR